MNVFGDKASSKLGRIINDRFVLTSILGQGAYGVVYLGYDYDTNTQYAVKHINNLDKVGTRLSGLQMKRRLHEVNLHARASTHPNIVSIVKVVDEYDGLYIVMEYCDNGDLFTNICQIGQYAGNDALCKSVFLQLLDAVEHCHKLGIYHRDLKPENILLSHDDWIKLTDFGLATVDSSSLQFRCGSERYMSPECLNGDLGEEENAYQCAANDIWAIGIILINLVCASWPWRRASAEDPSFRAFQQQPTVLKKLIPITNELYDILKDILHPCQESRIGISEIRKRVLHCPKFTLPSCLKPRQVADGARRVEALPI